MKISERLAKWAYAWNVLFSRNEYYHSEATPISGEYRPYPRTINLCNLFWRTFTLTPLIILGGLGLATLLLLGLRAIAWEALLFTTIITGVVGLGIAVGHYFPARWIQSISDASDGFTSRVSPVFKAVGRAKKEVCPILDVESK